MKRTSILLGCALCLFSVQSRAWDPLGLKAPTRDIADTVERVLDQIDSLRKSTSENVGEHLAAVEGIVARTVLLTENSVTNVASSAIKQLSEEARNLERQVYRDLKDLIFEAECAGVRIGLDVLQQALADSVNTLRESKPRIKILGITVVEGAITAVDVVDPDLAYKSVKSARLASLLGEKGEGGVDAEADPYLFASTYANLARLAKQVRCHYTESPGLAVLFTRDIREMNRLLRPWQDLVTL